jgi:hypothetical protein
LENSNLVSYCATYDLCALSYVFDGTPNDLYGKCIDFAGPNYRGPPWTITLDLGQMHTFSLWRIPSGRSGNTHYPFGTAYLNYKNTAGVRVRVPNSQVINTDSPDQPPRYFQASFTMPISAREWQVYIDSYNPLQTLYQARFQLYLCEVQFGYIIPFLRNSHTPTGGYIIYIYIIYIIYIYVPINKLY